MNSEISWAWHSTRPVALDDGDGRDFVAALNALTEAARGFAQALDAARRERSIRYETPGLPKV